MAIRSDNDPSSAAPPSGIESGDLEQYGVWVKAEPRDILNENGESLSDFGLPSEPSAVTEESFLSEDEERLLGTFDSEFDSNQSAEDFSSDLGPLPDISDAVPSSKTDEIENLDVSLDDITPIDEQPAIHAGTDLDISTVRGLDSLEDIGPSSAPAPAGEMEDVSAQFLEDAEPSAPTLGRSAEKSSEFGIDDVTAQFLVESDDSIPLTTPADTAQDFESLDIDLQFDAEKEASTSGGRSKSGTFDDVAAVEASLSDSSQESGYEASERPARSGAPDLSSELLMKIAEELKNIRGELVALKTQISGIAVPPESVSKAPSTSEESSPGGFFAKEEDETIALTGDELDNILNTADFTEESVETASEPLLDEPLLPESGEYAADRRETPPAIEEIRLGEPESVDEIEEVPPESSLSDLVSVAEEGVHAMTPPPEDSSYLEDGDMVLDNGLSLEGAPPLEDVPLVEPDLSEFEIESEEGANALEISEELPLASDAREIKLDIDAGQEYGQVSGTPEAELLEAVPEIEDSFYDEISLHEELSDKQPEIPPVSSVEEASEVEELEEFGASPAASPPAPEAVSFESEEPAADQSIPVSEEPPVIDVLPPPAEEPSAVSSEAAPQNAADERLKAEIRSVLSYLDKLLDSLPEEKIEEFARSEYFDTYKRLFEELGLV